MNTVRATSHLRDSTIEQSTLLTLVIGPALVADICVRCSVEVGLGLDRKAVIVWLTPSASINCSRSSIFVLPLATVCCVHAVREKAFWECGVWEEVPERCYFVQENSTETESRNGWRRDEITNRENGVWRVNLTRKKNEKKNESENEYVNIGTATSGTTVVSYMERKGCNDI